MSDAYSIRLAEPADLEGIVRLAGELWPEEPAGDAREHMAATLAGEPHSMLPLVVFVAEFQGELVGFVEVGLRSHAEGCDGRRAVGYIEGWYVRPRHRLVGVGRALILRAEEWARAAGAVELGSDTWLNHQLSIDAHRALGFEVVERAVHFRKALT